MSGRTNDVSLLFIWCNFLDKYGFLFLDFLFPFLFICLVFVINIYHRKKGNFRTITLIVDKNIDKRTFQNEMVYVLLKKWMLASFHFIYYFQCFYFYSVYFLHYQPTIQIKWNKQYEDVKIKKQTMNHAKTH